MASLIPYTKQQLVERVRRHIVNDFPSSDLSISVNEVLLYIDQAVAFNMVGQVWNMAKVEGNIVMPEAYLTTYHLSTLSYDTLTREWYTTLPQPPVSLPLGYSITDVYPVLAGSGRGESFFPIKSKRTAYRKFMPTPVGGSYKVQGDKIILAASDGGSLLSYTFYVEMAKSRTESLTETLNLPDDAIELIFNNVIAKLKDRLQLPQDVIQDDISTGNKTS